jgi:hypothetical protein
MVRITFSALLLLLTLSACRPPEGQSGSAASLPAGVGITIELAAEPVIGRNPATVTVTDSAQAVSGASVTITGDMTHAGMIPVIREAVEQEPGRYRADTFEFDMGGDWFLTADVTLPDGRRARAVLPVAVATGR